MYIFFFNFLLNIYTCTVFTGYSASPYGIDTLSNVLAFI